MNSYEAIQLLRSFQAQIVHGNNTFGDIADVIERLERVCGESEINELQTARMNLLKVPETVIQLRAETARLREMYRGVREIVEELHDCGCTDGAFIYGCSHHVRRLRAALCCERAAGVDLKPCEQGGARSTTAAISDTPTETSTEGEK